MPHSTTPPSIRAASRSRSRRSGSDAESVQAAREKITVATALHVGMKRVTRSVKWDAVRNSRRKRVVQGELQGWRWWSKRTFPKSHKAQLNQFQWMDGWFCECSLIQLGIRRMKPDEDHYKLLKSNCMKMNECFKTLPELPQLQPMDILMKNSCSKILYQKRKYLQQRDMQGNPFKVSSNTKWIDASKKFLNLKKIFQNFYNWLLFSKNFKFRYVSWVWFGSFD